MFVETKVTLKDIDIEFLRMYATLGFNSPSELLARALDLLKIEVENRKKKQLEESAQLYAELFDEDDEAKDWVDSATKDWE